MFHMQTWSNNPIFLAMIWKTTMICLDAFDKFKFHTGKISKWSTSSPSPLSSTNWDINLPLLHLKVLTPVLTKLPTTVPISRVKNCNHAPKVVLFKLIFLSSPSVSLPVVSQSLHYPLGHGQLLISSSPHQGACGGPHPRLQLLPTVLKGPPLSLVLLL